MLKKLIICFALAVLTAMSVDARLIDVTGLVTVQGKGVPVAGIPIFDGKTVPRKKIGETGPDGRYTVTIDTESKLEFRELLPEAAKMYEAKVVAVDGQFEINVQLTPRPHNIVLDEQVVTDKGKAIKKGSGTLSMKGNYVMIDNTIELDKRYFKSGRRQIIQPVVLIQNKGKIVYPSPVVLDSEEYAITQERMDDWDKSVDPLTPDQRITKTNFKNGTTVTVHDSVYVEDPNDYVIQLALYSIEDYNRVFRIDTTELSHGAKNPLRFLSYNVPGMEMNDSDREKFQPSSRRQFLNTEGEMNLTFPVGKSNLDPTLGDNAAELDKLNKEVDQILSDRSTQLNAIRIHGYSSPEGGYEKNLKLAHDRMKTTMDVIVRSIGRSELKRIEQTTDAEVAPWEDVVKMLRADSLFEEANQIQEIIDKNSNIDAQGIAITRLPFYSTTIKETYLPKLRRVAYVISVQRHRELTLPEIEERYKSDPRTLTQYDLYRYYNTLTGDEREAVLRKSVEMYPFVDPSNHFVAAVTDLSKVMLDKGENPFDLIEPYLQNPDMERPIALEYNYAVSAMKKRRYDIAEPILGRYQGRADARKAIAYFRVIHNTVVDGDVEEICKDNPLNTVVVMLAMGEDSSAWLEAQDLGDSAEENYVKAIAANRILKQGGYDMALESQAITYLKNAIKLKPSYQEVAEGDGDLSDLVEYALDELKAEEEALKEIELEAEAEAAAAGEGATPSVQTEE